MNSNRLSVDQLKVNQKVILSAADADNAFIVVVFKVAEDEIKFRLKHSGPIGGDPTVFVATVKDDKLYDGTGRELIVKRFSREAQ